MKNTLERKDIVPGGLADNKNISDIAKKHKVSTELILGQFKKGIDVEMEHTNDKAVATEIALDHLYEDPIYYDKLAVMEESVEKVVNQLLNII